MKASVKDSVCNERSLKSRCASRCKLILNLDNRSQN